jgi:hypothetical protein
MRNWTATTFTATVLLVGLFVATGSSVAVADPLLSPTIEGVSPSVGPESGGTELVITGTNLDGMNEIRIGGVTATDMAIISDTEVRATTPPSTGTVDVYVHSLGDLEATLPAAFTYEPVAPAEPPGPPAPDWLPPVIESHLPITVKGVLNGIPGFTPAAGEWVQLIGQNFSTVTSVELSGSAVPFNIQSDSALAFYVETNGGPASLTVRNADGAVTIPDAIALVPLPDLTMGDFTVYPDSLEPMTMTRDDLLAHVSFSGLPKWLEFGITTGADWPWLTWADPVTWDGSVLTIPSLPEIIASGNGAWSFPIALTVYDGNTGASNYATVTVSGALTNGGPAPPLPPTDPPVDPPSDPTPPPVSDPDPPADPSSDPEPPAELAFTGTETDIALGVGTGFGALGMLALWIGTIARRRKDDEMAAAEAL